MDTTPGNVIAIMHETLRPKGTEPIVRLFLKDSSYYNQEFVTKCIVELEKALSFSAILGEPLSPLQMLASHVLMHSAHLDELLREPTK